MNAAALDAGGRLDFITIVPDLEPTPDVNLGLTIRLVKSLGCPVGVISSRPLMAAAGVNDELAEADRVSPKVDPVADGGSGAGPTTPTANLRWRRFWRGFEPSAGFSTAAW